MSLYVKSDVFISVDDYYDTVDLCYIVVQTISIVLTFRIHVDIALDMAGRDQVERALRVESWLDATG